jgi:hypothetical protein
MRSDGDLTDSEEIIWALDSDSGDAGREDVERYCEEQRWENDGAKTGVRDLKKM